MTDYTPAPPSPPPLPPGYGPAVSQPWSTPPPALTGQWQRLHPLSPIVRSGPALVVIFIAVLGGGIRSANRTSEYVRIGIVVLFVLMGVVSWVVTRWRLADGALQIETGLLRRQSLRFPFSQIQAIDIVSPGLARAFGLAELRIRMASGGRSSGRLAYMPAHYAEAVRAELLSRRTAAARTPAGSTGVGGTPGGAAAGGAAAGGAAAGGVPAGGVPAGVSTTAGSTAPSATPAISTAGASTGVPVEVAFTPLFTVNPARLVGSILTSSAALFVYLIVVVLICVAVAAPSAAGGAFAGSTSTLLAFVAAMWSRFNGEYRLSIGAGPEGLHVRTGLIQTSAETIPWGRIQALRTVQPVLWRAFGWVRVEVDVAGHNVSGRQDRSARRAGKALIPVGTTEEAGWLVNLVMPGAPTDPVPPPRRARWKAPLRYRNLSFAANPRYVVTTSGRLRRITDRVPLEKVQSVRWSEGPAQRQLRLASIHLDTAGRSVFCVARDRDATEAKDILSKLPDMCRDARADGRAAPLA